MSEEKQDATEYDFDNLETGFEQQSETQDDKAPKKHKRSKAVIVLIVALALVVVVVGGGGIAYATQHDNPAFCNFICHTPMDPYVESWQDGTSVQAYQANSDVILSVTAHKESEQELVCVDCHKDGLDTQIEEGKAWVSGSYTLPLEGFKVVNGDEAAEGEKLGTETCLTAGCHEGISSLEELASNSSLSDQRRNPHDPTLHNGALDCSTCHQTHEASVMWCSQCHADAMVPEGWLTYRESQQLKKDAGITG